MVNTVPPPAQHPGRRQGGRATRRSTPNPSPREESVMKIRHPSSVLRASACAAALAAPLVCAATAWAAPSFTTFESGQVRPLALSPDKHLLFAVNTPDGRLEVFGVDGQGLTHRGSIPVGLEPVAVSARSEDEVWVVNHL